MIDVKQIFSQHNINFVEKGPNTKQGEISINCPLCKDDPSQHLGINPANGFWACWRNKRHRGKNVIRLFKLLGINYVGDKPEILQKLLDRSYFNKNSIKIESQEIDTKKYTQFPLEFVNLLDDSVFSKSYLKYLGKRGFTNPAQVAKEYKLIRSLGANKWAARLIIPIFIEDEISWTGRTIGDNPVRYLSPSVGEAKNIKDTIFNYNELKETTGDILTICEGPLDSMKVDWYNKPSIRSTCLFGLVATDQQLILLDQVCANFNSIMIGLDQGTLPQALDLCSQLRKFNPIIMKLPKKDFGEMTHSEMKNLFNTYETSL